MAKKKKPAKKQDWEREKSIGALFIPAGIFIGMGYGFFVDEVVGGLFLGLGIGFILFAITKLFEQGKKK